MLVLSRKQGQRMIVGDDIVITITRIGSRSVRIGVDAPEHIKVLRGELEAIDLRPGADCPIGDQTPLSTAEAISNGAPF